MLTSTTDNFKVFKKGRLEPETLSELNNLTREVRSMSSKTTEFTLKDLPQFEFGEFEMLPLRSHTIKNDAIDKMRDNYNYFVVQFPLNFYPDEFLIDDVKFAVDFKSNNEVKVVDLYPKEKVEEVKRNISIAISPSFTFSEVSAKIADLSYNFVYHEIRPVIYGGGTGRPHVYWNIKNSLTNFIAGVKIMHVIIKATKTTKKITLKADLQATVHVGNKFFNGVSKFFNIKEDPISDRVTVDFDLRTCLPTDMT